MCRKCAALNPGSVNTGLNRVVRNVQISVFGNSGGIRKLFFCRTMQSLRFRRIILYYSLWHETWLEFWILKNASDALTLHNPMVWKNDLYDQQWWQHVFQATFLPWEKPLVILFWDRDVTVHRNVRILGQTGPTLRFWPFWPNCTFGCVTRRWIVLVWHLMTLKNSPHNDLSNEH